jgi:hypothetical protein
MSCDLNSRNADTRSRLRQAACPRVSRPREPLRHLPHSKARPGPATPACHLASRFPITPVARTATIVIRAVPSAAEPFEGAKRAQDLALCRGSVVRGRCGARGDAHRRRHVVRIRRRQARRRHRMRRPAVLPERRTTAAATPSRAASASTAGCASASTASATPAAGLRRTAIAERQRVRQRGPARQRQRLRLRVD